MHTYTDTLCTHATYVDTCRCRELCILLFFCTSVVVKEVVGGEHWTNYMIEQYPVLFTLHLSLRWGFYCSPIDCTYPTHNTLNIPNSMMYTRTCTLVSLYTLVKSFTHTIMLTQISDPSHSLNHMICTYTHFYLLSLSLSLSHTHTHTHTHHIRVPSLTYTHHYQISSDKELLSCV